MKGVRKQLLRVLGSLKVRVTLGGIAALVTGIGLINVLLVSKAENELLRAEEQREMGSASRVAFLLSRRLVALQAEMEVEALRLDRGVFTRGRALEQFSQGQRSRHTAFTEMFLISPRGEWHIVFDAAGQAGAAPRRDAAPYIEQTFNSRQPVVSDAFLDLDAQQPSVVLTRPVSDALGTYAVLGARVRLDNRDLLNGLAETRDTDTTSLVVVTDAAGQVVAPANTRWLLQPLTQLSRLRAAYASWLDAGAPAEPQGLLLNNEGEVVAAAGVVGTRWMVWRTRAHSEVLAPLHFARNAALTPAAALIALFSSVQLIMLWWLLQPLKRLGQRAQRMFDPLTRPSEGWPRAAGEIGQLARTLRRAHTRHARLVARNAQMLQQLDFIMSAAPIGIAIIRNDGFEWVSAEFGRIFGQLENQLVSHPMRVVFASARQQAEFRAQEQQAFSRGASYIGEWQLVRADQTLFWAHIRSKQLVPDQAVYDTIWSLTDVNDQRLSRQRLEWSASHDMLTKLRNREFFMQRAKQAFDQREKIGPTVMMYIDLDHFKPVNDLAGHLAGDAMLVAVASSLNAAIRTSDVAARLGGDEFGVLLEDCAAKDAIERAEDVCARIAAIALPWGNLTLTIGASVGVSVLEPHMVRLNDCVGAADAACYRAKNDGRGVTRVFTPNGPAGRSPVLR